jgi:hypothetical protein
MAALRTSHQLLEDGVTLLRAIIRSTNITNRVSLVSVDPFDFEQGNWDPDDIEDVLYSEPEDD